MIYHFISERLLSKSQKIRSIDKGNGEKGCCWVVKSCSTLCDPMNCSMPGSSVFYYLLEFAQIHAPFISDAIYLMEERVHVGENINFHSCNGRYYGHSSNKNRTLYVIKKFCFWIYTGRKLNQYLEEISALPWSLKHYSQHPRCGNNLSVCWWMNGHVHYQTQKYRYCIISFMCRIWSQNQKQQRRVVVMGWGLGQMGKCWSKGINFQL